MIPLTGVSAKTKDRRVDRVLEKLGYEATACEIFYSPVMVWVTYLMLFFMALLPVSLCLLALLYRFPVYGGLYFLLGYLMAAYLNNSVVLTQDKLIIINPNFPFRRSVIYDLAELRDVKIDQSKWLWSTFFIFAHSGSNYVEISTDDKTRRFYCTCLQVDAFDENLTEKTMDDLHFALEKRNVPTEFNLP